ncbi:hypothetical protein DQ392_30170 [Streptomyces reniochalinae]|uniref:Carrier domain-containing protein n=2 Tax=Streptomyces reniochalinae TaxID=2250578 RepID=A0A367E778_9ACTN|nr:hypothetical protein DQ392_30170 [Streptomyces reniochalinae]
MAAGLDETGLARLARTGIAPLSAQDGLALFDASVCATRPLVVPVRLRLDRPVDDASPLLRDLVRRPVRRTADSSAAPDALRDQLAARSPEERRETLTELVRTHAAAALGYAEPRAIVADRAFQELGFDSLTAVEFRNRLNAPLGLRLPTTLIFDYPTPRALADHVLSLLFPEADAEANTGGLSEAQVRRLLATVPLRRLHTSGLLDPLLRLADSPDDEHTQENTAQDIDEMDVDALIQIAFDGNDS